MHRFLLKLFITIGPMLVLIAAGCEQEIRTHSESERIQESDPQMVSPGEPVVE